MALTESLTIPLGTLMPEFTLPDAFGTIYQSRDLFGEKGLLVVFSCNHCPYAQALWPRLIRLAAWAHPHGVPTIAINPNIHPDYPDDAPEAMKTFLQQMGITFPYLVDETQDTARAFKAMCTPDLYLYDTAGKLVYHGRVDDNWKNEEAVSREDLRMAIDDLILGKPARADQKPSMGCSIKWKSSQ